MIGISEDTWDFATIPQSTPYQSARSSPPVPPILGETI